MYLWIIVATFMLALFYYNLSVRPDVDRSYMETKAQTVIAKFKIQHNAFIRYLDSQKVPASGAPSDPQFVSYIPGFGYNNGSLFNCDEQEAETVQERIENYFPMGYTPDEGTYSKVFCFEPTPLSDLGYTDYELNCNNPSVMADDTCCSVPYVKVYAVSWTQIPSRWLNRSGKPVTDMMSVMSKSDGYGRNFGYVTTTDDFDVPVISGGIKLTSQSGPEEEPYQVIYTAITNDEEYKQTCENSPCLIAIHKVQNREESTNE